MDICDFDKQDKISQKPYSHVIDAIMAFMLALEAHPNEGAMRISKRDEQTIWGHIDKVTGELTDTIFPLLAPPSHTSCEIVTVKPQSTVTKIDKLMASDATLDQLFSRKLFKENMLGVNFYSLHIIDNKVFKGFYSNDNGSPLFHRDGDKVLTKSLSDLDSLVNAGLYKKKQLSELVIYVPIKKVILPFLFTILNDKKENKFTSTLNIKLSTLLINNYYYTMSKELSNAPEIVKKQSGCNPYINRWQCFLDNWKKIAGALYREEKNNDIVVADSQQQEWTNYCLSFSKKLPHCHSRSPIKKFTMKAISQPSGQIALVRRNNGDGTHLYQILNFDVSVIGKGQEQAIALKSPNLVCFNKAILTKGYAVNNIENAGKTIDVNKLVNDEQLTPWLAKGHQLNAIVEGETQFILKGVPKSFVEDNLLDKGEQSEFKLTGEINFPLDKTVKQGVMLVGKKLKDFITPSPKSGKPINIISHQNTVDLKIALTRDGIAKLIE